MKKVTRILCFFVLFSLVIAFISTNSYSASKKVTVKFDRQDGSAVTSKVVSYDTPIPEPDPPERAGYIFTGWTKDPEGEFPWPFEEETITYNITLYAQWEKTDYVDIPVQTNGGTYIEPIRVKYNDLVPMPDTTPTRMGYTFAGWYKDSDCLIKWDFKKERGTHYKTMYAKWIKGVTDANVIWKDLFNNGLITDVEVNSYFSLPLLYNLVVGEDVIITSSNPEVIKVSPRGRVDFIDLGTADLTIYLPASKSSSTKTFNVVAESEFDRSFSNWFLKEGDSNLISFGRRFYWDDYKHPYYYYYFDRIDDKEVKFQDIGDVGMPFCRSYYQREDYVYGVDYKLVSSDPSVVKVNKNGSVKCVGAGRAVVTLTLINEKGGLKKGTYKQTIDVMDFSDEFFTNQITQAYKDPSYEKYLSEKSMAVLKKAKKVIAEVIKPGMTDLQKAKAIHDYIILNTTYDYHDDVNPSTPYSCLIHGKAICSGYAQTFGMFMTMLDIPNTYVIGEAAAQGHGWNRIKIGNAWYNVDTTWDDSISEKGKIKYNYFCIPDKEMMRTHTFGGRGRTLPME